MHFGLPKAQPACRRQRPADGAKQKEPDSGTTTAHTDKPLLLVNASTGQVVSRGPTRAGTMHDTQAADEPQMASPVNATRDKETGWQGDEPGGGLPPPPTKNRQAGTCV